MDTEERAILRAIGARLPRAGTPLTPGGAEHWIRRLGLPRELVLRWEGARTLKEMVAWHRQRNPELDLRGWVSLLLEQMTMRPSWRGCCAASLHCPAHLKGRADRDRLLDQGQRQAA